MNALSIPYRLTLLVAGLLAITLLAATANLMGRRDGSTNLHRLYATRVEPLGELLALEALYGVQLAQRVRDGAALAPLAAQGRQRWQAFARQTAPAPELERVWSQADARLAQAADEPGRAAALRSLQALSAALDRAATQLHGLAAAEDARARQDFEAALTRNLAIFGATLALAAWLSWRQIVAITRPIRRAVGVAEAVADGRLGLGVEGGVGGPRETRALLGALAQMATSLHGIVREVRDCGEALAHGSAEIAAGNADLSRRTESQASSLEQTAASMEQLSAAVRHNADAAHHAEALAAQARAAVHAGQQRVDQMGRTMGEIAASSARIGDIIGTIDAIAFQTNILALNAAVEAARAGAQGRGFAVVASEVRGLAGRSAEAAREVRELITASRSRVDAGSEQAGLAGAAMATIVAQIGRVGALIGEISTGSREQAKGLTEIGAAVAQLDEVTQQNAALVEQSAAAAESLRGQAGRMMELVARFELGAAAAVAL